MLIVNCDHFKGIDKFPGRVLHSHDFRASEEFAGKRLLLIGASYSAEDIALQCMKYGASSVICTWRTKSVSKFKIPKNAKFKIHSQTYVL